MRNNGAKCIKNVTFPKMDHIVTVTLVFAWFSKFWYF